MTSSETQDVRRVLVIAHTGREAARDVAAQFCRALHAHGILLRLLEDEADELDLGIEGVEVVKATAEAGVDCELAVVIGGDGTILRAAELARECGTPLLGVNLGHVGFLAEAESDDVDITIDAIVHRRYTAEERLTLDVSVYHDKELVASTWALNEASVEKAARERMIEVVVEVDGRPAVALGLRRGRLRHPDRVDRLQLQRRRPDRLAGRRGPAAGADQRPRPVRPAAGGRRRPRCSPSR